MDMTIDPAEDADGLNYQDRHNLGIKEAGKVESYIDVAVPPLQARIEIICNGASITDLEALHYKLFAGYKNQAFVNGTLRIVI